MGSHGTEQGGSNNSAGSDYVHTHTRSQIKTAQELFLHAAAIWCSRHLLFCYRLLLSFESASESLWDSASVCRGNGSASASVLLVSSALIKCTNERALRSLQPRPSGVANVTAGVWGILLGRSEAFRPKNKKL